MPLLLMNDGTEINYRIDDFTDPWRERGGVRTVLMHHSFTSGLENHTPWVPTLARKYKVVRFDSRGVEGSSAPPEPFRMTIAQLVEDTLSVMDQLGLEKVHFMGCQSGGIVGRIIAASHPERIISLTLCNSPHKLADTPNRKEALGGAEPGEYLGEFGFWEWREKSYHFRMDMRRADPRMVAWEKEVQSRVPLHILASQLSDTYLRDTATMLKDIKCPTLLINGDRGNIVPPEMLAFMSLEIPDSRTVVFPNVGDSLHMIIPEECAKAMLDFITALDGD